MPSKVTKCMIFFIPDACKRWLLCIKCMQHESMNSCIVWNVFEIVCLVYIVDLAVCVVSDDIEKVYNLIVSYAVNMQ